MVKIDIATIEFLPLTIAYATTIHKSQGKTIDNVSVSLKGAWENGQGYVALSRVRDSKSLKIEGDITREMFKTDPRVKDFHERNGIGNRPRQNKII